jgi:hypothetical protein
MNSQDSSFRERFSAYFERDVAQKAAKPLANGVEIQLEVSDEIFTFTKDGGKNLVRPGAAGEPQVVFTLTPQAAQEILDDPSDEIGHVGVHILKLIVSTDANKRVSFKLRTGFLGLFSKGYFGVVTAGGAQFAAFLASKGLNGIGAIKDALKKMRT